MNYFFHNKEGFTIQEILVVLIVGSILVSLSLALYQFTSDLFKSWQGTNELKNDVERILNIVSMDVQHSDVIMERSVSSLTLAKGTGTSINYTYENQVLKRNDVDITPKGARSFQIKWESVENEKKYSDVIHVKILAQSKWIAYESDVICGVIPSSQSEFIKKR